MGRSKLSKLALAIAAAGFVSMPFTLPANAYEMAATEVVENLGAYLAANDIERARELILRLRALGITQIQIGSALFSLDDIEAAIAGVGTAPADALLAQLVALAATATSSAFIADTVVIASVESTVVLPDAFPTGSAGIG